MYVAVDLPLLPHLAMVHRPSHRLYMQIVLLHRRRLLLRSFACAACKPSNSWSPMSERATKLRRLYAGSGIPHSKLVALMDALRKEDDVHDAIDITRRQLRDSLDTLWKDIVQQEMLPLKSGAAFVWDCVSFAKLLQHAVRVSPNFRDVLRSMWEARPCTSDTPYHLVCYGDEVVPGNVLRLDNKRKVFCFYVCIREIGDALIKDEHMWFPVAILRTIIAKEVTGGFSNAMRVLLRRWFLEDKLSDRGVCLDLGLAGTRFATFYFALGNIVADGDALRAVWSCKGASGKLPCICCKNVLKDRIESPYLVHISCNDASRFDLASDADLWTKADQLHAQALVVGGTKKAFEELQMAYGFTYSPEGLLWDLDLRAHVKPAGCITFDAMHAVLSNGIAQNEAALLITCLKEVGVSFAVLRSFVSADWKFCKALGSQSVLRGCFSDAREHAFKEGGAFKAGASEMLLAFPVLLYFLHSVVAPQGLLKNQTDSFGKLGKVMRIVQRGKEGINLHAELSQAIQDHAVAFAVAYPDDEVKPKNHYIHHVPLQLSRDGLIIDAFVGERKHQSIKALATDVQNTRTFEQSVIKRAIAQQMAVLQDPACFRDGLLRAKPFPELAASEGAQCAFASTSMRWCGTNISAGDLLVLDGAVCIVEACVSVDEKLAVMSKRYASMGQAF